MLKNCHNRKHLKRKAEKGISERHNYKMPKCLEEYHTSYLGSTSDFTETESSSVQSLGKNVDGRSFILKLIENKPLLYIGLPKNHYWLIELIGRELKVPTLHIIVTLYRLKNNDTFVRIADLFQFSISTVWKAFYKKLHL